MNRRQWLACVVISLISVTLVFASLPAPVWTALSGGRASQTSQLYVQKASSINQQYVPLPMSPLTEADIPVVEAYFEKVASLVELFLGIHGGMHAEAVGRLAAIDPFLRDLGQFGKILLLGNWISSYGAAIELMVFELDEMRFKLDDAQASMSTGDTQYALFLYEEILEWSKTALSSGPGPGGHPVFANPLMHDIFDSLHVIDAELSRLEANQTLQDIYIQAGASI